MRANKVKDFHKANLLFELKRLPKHCQWRIWVSVHSSTGRGQPCHLCTTLKCDTTKTCVPGPSDTLALANLKGASLPCAHCPLSVDCVILCSVLRSILSWHVGKTRDQAFGYCRNSAPRKWNQEAEERNSSKTTAKITDIGPTTLWSMEVTKSRRTKASCKRTQASGGLAVQKGRQKSRFGADAGKWGAGSAERQAKVKVWS